MTAGVGCYVGWITGGVREWTVPAGVWLGGVLGLVGTATSLASQGSTAMWPGMSRDMPETFWSVGDFVCGGC